MDYAQPLQLVYLWYREPCEAPLCDSDAVKHFCRFSVHDAAQLDSLLLTSWSVELHRFIELSVRSLCRFFPCMKATADCIHRGTSSNPGLSESILPPASPSVDYSSATVALLLLSFYLFYGAFGPSQSLQPCRFIFLRDHPGSFVLDTWKPALASSLSRSIAIDTV